MIDHFKNHITGPRDPIETAEVVTPDDAGDLKCVTRAVYVGAAGDMRVTMANGDVVTFVFGQGWHPIRIKQVWATGTTASSIVACS